MDFYVNRTKKEIDRLWLREKLRKAEGKKISSRFSTHLIRRRWKKQLRKKQMAFDIENLVNGKVNVNLFFHVRRRRVCR